MRLFSYPPHLFDLQPSPESSEELERFAQLQSTLETRWRRFSETEAEPYTVVVVPSQSIPAEELAVLDGAEHSEERMLHHLMHLRRPNTRVVLVTSKAVEGCIVDYYLGLLGDAPLENGRERLRLLDTSDDSPRPLTEKILERPDLLRRIKDAIGDPQAAHIEHYNTSVLERTLAVQLGIPMNATDPALLRLGTKSGSREAFARAGVAMPEGRENLRDAKDLARALAEIWEARPETRRIVLKLNCSYSGEGNALLDLTPLVAVRPGEASSSQRAASMAAALPRMRFGLDGLDWEQYKDLFARNGGVCEAWLDGEGKSSPSVQVCIDPSGRMHVVSTHDQVLAGSLAQSFQGATFPADQRDRLAVQTEAEKVGGVLARDGVIGCFSIDFLARPQAGRGDEILALEINLRHGGTTHCFNMLKLITNGRYDRRTGRFSDRSGKPRVYHAVDVLRQPSLRGISPTDLIASAERCGLAMGPAGTGVMFHRLGSLYRHGKIGFTAVSSSPEEAEGLYRRTLDLLERPA